MCSGNSGVEIRLLNDSLQQWEVQMFDWAFDETSPLHQDLKTLSEADDDLVPLRMRISFPDDFPFAPPLVFCTSPPLSSEYVFEGALCMEMCAAPAALLRTRLHAHTFARAARPRCSPLSLSLSRYARASRRTLCRALCRAGSSTGSPRMATSSRCSCRFAPFLRTATRASHRSSPRAEAARAPARRRCQPRSSTTRRSAQRRSKRMSS